MIIMIIHYGRLLKDRLCRKFRIVDISLSQSKEFAMLYIERPKDYKVRPGQYAFVNVPSVSKVQWHPFSIASSPLSKYLIFMIKRNGDWTAKFIDKLVEAKKNKLRVQEMDFTDKEAIFNIMLESEGKVRDSKVSYFPDIHISWPVTSAAETAIYRKNVIMIGAGSGIAPYLSFIEDQSDLVQKICLRQEIWGFDFAHIILIVRSSDEISWISNYI